MLPNQNPISDLKLRGKVREHADAYNFGRDILVLSLVASCGLTSPLNGKLWRVLDPTLGQAFIFCAANHISLNDIIALGLDSSTPFSCYESALDEETRAFVEEQSVLKFIE